jgi:hypothetical protein
MTSPDGHRWAQSRSRCGNSTRLKVGAQTDETTRMRRFVGIVTSLLAVAVLWSPAAGAAKAPTKGEAAKPVDQIVADAEAALTHVQTVKMAGTVESGGQRVSMNLVAGQGKGGGTLWINGAQLHVVVANPNIYVQSDAAGWAALAGTSSPVSGLIADRWIRASVTNPDFTDLAGFFDLSTSNGSFHPSGPVVKTGATSFHGKKVIGLHDTGPDDNTLYVAASGTPYPLGVVGTGAKSGSFTFSGFNAAKVPPEPTQFVDLSTLGQ